MDLAPKEIAFKRRSIAEVNISIGHFCRFFFSLQLTV